jgi:FkbM family methyltransferase
MQKSMTNKEFNNLFKDNEDVFFIQIGANDGKSLDPIYELVNTGNWSGVLYEPGESAYNELIKNYENNKNLIFEKKAVSTYDGEGELFCGTTNQHFTLNFEHAKYMFDVEPQSLKVEIVSPKTILEKYNIKKLDLLMIDVEGHDFEIIKAFPFEIIKPKVIRFEYMHLKAEEPIGYLESNGYECYFNSDGDIIAILKEEGVTDVTLIKVNTNNDSIIGYNGKRSIIVHNPCNEHTRYFRNYNLFWDKITEELKNKYNVRENRYYEFANSNYFNINLRNKTENIETYLMECEYVIEFEDTGEIYVLSVSDELSCAMLSEKDNPLLKKVLISQFNRKHIEHHVQDNIYKYSPWIYFPSGIHDLEQYYYKRKVITELKDKMVFRGTSLKDRSILSFMDSNIFDGPNTIGGAEPYFNDIINYKVGLSVAGRGELCYRDVEYMAIGLPFIRFEYNCELNPKLIPDYHYISVNRPNDLIHDRSGDLNHAKLLQDRFLQIKDDKEFLNFISNNARDYYKKYLSYDNNVKHTINLLNI